MVPGIVGIRPRARIACELVLVYQRVQTGAIRAHQSVSGPWAVVQHDKRPHPIEFKFTLTIVFHFDKGANREQRSISEGMGSVISCFHPKCLSFLAEKGRRASQAEVLQGAGGPASSVFSVGEVECCLNRGCWQGIRRKTWLKTECQKKGRESGGRVNPSTESQKSLTEKPIPQRRIPPAKLGQNLPEWSMKPFNAAVCARVVRRRWEMVGLQEAKVFGEYLGLETARTISDNLDGATKTTCNLFVDKESHRSG